jgi:hypothetical protein
MKVILTSVDPSVRYTTTLGSQVFICPACSLMFANQAGHDARVAAHPALRRIHKAYALTQQVKR